MVRLMPMLLAISSSEKPSRGGLPICTASGMISFRREKSWSSSAMLQMIPSIERAGSARLSRGERVLPSSFSTV